MPKHIYIKDAGWVSQDYLETLRMYLGQWNGRKVAVLGRGAICVITEAPVDGVTKSSLVDRSSRMIGGTEYEVSYLTKVRDILSSMINYTHLWWWNISEGICNNYHLVVEFEANEPMLGSYRKVGGVKRFACHDARFLNRLFQHLGYADKYPIGEGSYEQRKELYISTVNKWEGWQLEARLELIQEAVDYLDVIIAS